MAKNKKESEDINWYEVYFRWWLEELASAGLASNIVEQPETFVLKNAIPVYYEQVYVRKDNIHKDFNLFQPLSYTADFKVDFDVRLLHKLYGVILTGKRLLLSDPNLEKGNVYQNTLFYSTSQMITMVENEKKIDKVTLYFDVKPSANAIRFSPGFGSSRDFRYNQRLVYENYGIYVNKVVPIGTSTALYNKTFTPTRYLFTDNDNGYRKKKINKAFYKIDELDWYKSLQTYLKEKGIL